MVSIIDKINWAGGWGWSTAAADIAAINKWTSSYSSGYSYAWEIYNSYSRNYMNNDYVRDFYVRNYIPYDKTNSAPSYTKAYQSIVNGLTELNYRSMWSAESARIVFEQKQDTMVWRGFGIFQWKAPSLRVSTGKKPRSKNTVIGW